MAYISVYDTTSDLSSDELINEILTTSTPGYIDVRELISEKIKDMFKWLKYEHWRYKSI